MPVTGIAAAALPIVGGIAGSIVTAEDERLAREAQKRALDKILGISAPSIAEQYVTPQQYELAGKLTPEQEQEILAKETALANISTDPALRAAQLKALAGLEERGEKGLTAVEEAELRKAEKQAAQMEMARRAAIQERMQAQGRGGSGAQLAAELASSQAAAERQSTQGLDITALGQQRALEALVKAGVLGGDIRKQEFGEQSEIAQAKDLMERFNTANRIGTQQRNVAGRNEASRFNLTSDQAIRNANVEAANQAQAFNKGLSQRDFENRMRVTSAQAAAESKDAANRLEQAAETRAMLAGVGQAAGKGVAAAGSYKAPSAGASVGMTTVPTDFEEELKKGHGVI